MYIYVCMIVCVCVCGVCVYVVRYLGGGGGGGGGECVFGVDVCSAFNHLPAFKVVFDVTIPAQNHMVPIYACSLTSTYI